MHESDHPAMPSAAVFCGVFLHYVQSAFLNNNFPAVLSSISMLHGRIVKKFGDTKD